MAEYYYSVACTIAIHRAIFNVLESESQRVLDGWLVDSMVRVIFARSLSCDSRLPRHQLMVAAIVHAQTHYTYIFSVALCIFPRFVSCQENERQRVSE